MRIILSAIETALVDAWQEHCGGVADLTIHRGSILDLQVDAVVSPANSFGFMDGGIDLAYSHHFGWHVQERLQQVIKDKHQAVIFDFRLIATSPFELKVCALVIGLNEGFVAKRYPRFRSPVNITPPVKPSLSLKSSQSLRRR